MSGYPWNRFFMPWQYAPSDTGAPSPGDRLYFYASGTSTPLSTFADSTLSTPNVNPVVADQNGIFPDIFMQNASYRVVWTDDNGDEKRTADPVSPFVPTSASQQATVVLNCTVDANGGTPLVGICGDLYAPFDCDLSACVLQASPDPGDLVMDVWAKPFATNDPPTQTDSIVASDPPTLGSSVSSIDTTLTGWTTHIAAGTALRFSITSIDGGITRFTLSLVATRSS